MRMLIPAGHKVLIRPGKVERKTESGILLHYGEEDQLQEAQYQIGVIVALGDDAYKAFRKMNDKGEEVNGQPWAVPGDVVYYARYAGQKIRDPYTGEDLLIFVDEDVNLIIRKGDNPDYEAPQFTLKIKAEDAIEKETLDVGTRKEYGH